MHHTRFTGLLPLLLSVLIAAGILGCAETPAPLPPTTPATTPADAPDGTSGPRITKGPGHVYLEIFADDKDPATATFLKDLDTTLTKAFTPEQLHRRVLNPTDKVNYARLVAYEKASGTKQFAPVEAFLSVVYDYVGPDDPNKSITDPAQRLGPTIVQDADGFPEPDGHPLALIGMDAIAARLQPAIRVLLYPNKGLLSAAKPELLQAAAERIIVHAGTQFKLPPEFPGEINSRANTVVKKWTLVPTIPASPEPPAPPVLYLLYYPIDCPVCSDTELLIEVHNGKILQIEALRPIEKSGVPIPAEAKKFLDQFTTLLLDGALAKKIAPLDGISGATKTAHTVKYLLEQLDNRLHPPAPALAPAP